MLLFGCIVSAFTLSTVVLLYNLFSYGRYLPRKIPQLGRCLLLIVVSLLQSFLSFACLMLPQGPGLTTLISVNIVLGYLLNVVSIQLLLLIIGFNQPWMERLLNGLFVLPVLGLVAAITDPWHDLFLGEVVKDSAQLGYAVETRPLGVAFSIVSGSLLAVMLILSFTTFVRKKAEFLNPKVNLLILLSMLVVTGVGLLDNLVAGITGSGYYFNTFVAWIPVAVVCYAYFGYLRTARNKALQLTQEIYIVVDKWGSVVDVNAKGEAFLRRHGIAASRQSRQQLAALMGTQNAQLAEYEFEVDDGNGVQYYSASSFPLSDGISQYCGDGLIIQEVTVFREKMDALSTMATVDALTGVYNRHYFYEYSQQALRYSAAQGTPVTLLMMDLDNFKQVNDSYGHSVGDEVLREVCRICGENLRKNDVLFRYGGEELVVIGEDADLASGMKMAYRLLQAIGHEPIATSAGPLPITISIGGCTFVARPDDDIDRWVNTADEYMYKAKQNGRNRVEYLS